MGKQLELLKEIVLALSRVALLSYAMNPGNLEYIRQAELAAPALGVRLQIQTVLGAGDFQRAFSDLGGAGGKADSRIGCDVALDPSPGPLFCREVSANLIPLTQFRRLPGRRTPPTSQRRTGYAEVLT